MLRLVSVFGPSEVAICKLHILHPVLYKIFDYLYYNRQHNTLCTIYLCFTNICMLHVSATILVIIRQLHKLSRGYAQIRFSETHNLDNQEKRS
jgi:hypothetical protein